LSAVTRSVTLLTTVVALHRGTLDLLVGALGGTVTRLLAVVADVVGRAPGTGTVAGVDPLRRAESGNVADTTAVVARLGGTVTVGTGSRSTTSGRAVPRDVAGLTTPVAFTTAGGRSETGTTAGSAGASSGDVTLLTASVAGLGGPWLRAVLAQVAGLTTLVAGRVAGARADGSDVGWVTTVEATPWTSTTEHFVV
jgi:hypothetical protein